MKRKLKDKLYRELHDKIAEEYNSTGRAIRLIRSGVGHGESFSDIKKRLAESILNKNKSIALILENIKHHSEAVRLLTHLSEDSLEEIISRELETSKQDS